jgi:hypothetical protein
MKDNNTYVSVDIESNGPIPGDNSLLSFGAAAFSPEGKMTSTFYANLKELPDSHPDPNTMEWWGKNKEAYDATRLSLQDPGQAIGQFVSWVNKLDGKPVCVCYPAGFDFTYLYWYIIHFGFKSPFSFSALDIKSYASAMLKIPYREATKKNMPQRWFSNKPHTHNGLDDAIEQGELFIAMLKENTK